MASSPEKFYEAIDLIETRLIDMIRDSLVRENEMRTSGKIDAPIQGAVLRQRAVTDMKRLINLEKVRYP